MKILKRAWLATALLLASSLISGSANAVSPDISWAQIETDHFVVVYDSKHRELGEMYARYAEQAFRSVAPVFGLWPAKTVILVDDTTDVANGSATGFPYPLIQAYPVLPTAQDSIGDYGEWGLELITHEYTHILNFEPTEGWIKPFRYVFGSIVRPNFLLPRWYSEGLAVEMETRLSSFGRLRSANYLAIVRAMVDDKNLKGEDISRVNEVTIPDWPGGIRPYLLGALVWNEMVAMKDISVVRDLNLANSRRIPFFIEGPVQSLLGLTYSEVLAKAYTRAENIVAKQEAVLDHARHVDDYEIQQNGYFSRSPVVAPDHSKLAYIAREHNNDSLIYVVDRPPKEVDTSFGVQHPPEPVVDTTLATRLSWTPDSKALIHDGIHRYERYYQYSDIWKLDLETKEDTKITNGLRAREPVVSPDGKAIAFVQVTPGSTQLSVMAIDGSHPRTIYTPARQTRLAHPEFLSNQQLVFSEKGEDGHELLRLLDLRPAVEDGVPIAYGKPRTILANFMPASDARLTSEGLLFVSARSGVSNLYLANKSLTDAHAVTNTKTQITDGELDSTTGDLFYVRLVSYGPQIFRSPKSSWSQADAKPPQIGPLLDTAWPAWQKPDDKNIVTKSEPYAPGRYLLPRYWIPNLYVSPYYSYFSAETDASDPAGHHSYSLLASYDTLSNHLSAFGSYTNAQTRLPFTISAYDMSQYIGNGLNAQTTDVNGVAKFPFGGDLFPVTMGLGWDYSDTNIAQYSLRRNGPELSVLWNTARQRGLEISPERGGTIALDYRRYLPMISDIEYDQTGVSFARYFSGGLLPDRHVFALFLNGSIAPRLTNSLFGTTTLAGNYQSLPTVRGFVMRGYNSGVFIGKNMLTGTAEYRFPIKYQYSGFGTKPFFIQRWHGDLFVDALSLDGYVYDYTKSASYYQHLGYVYYGVGGEAKIDMTLFYHMPIQFIVGLYYGTDARSNPLGLFPFLGFGL